MKTSSLNRQKGAATFIVIGTMMTAIIGFGLIMEYAKLKIVDRELDNYARTIAETALRSELAITKKMLDEKKISSAQTDLVTNAVLAQSGYVLDGGENGNREIHKKITFGNFSDSDACRNPNAGNNQDCFIPLDSNAENPKAVEPPPEFSAVAVQLWTDDDFYGFVPQGRALYGMTDDQEGCYCDTRYESCVSGDLSKVEIAKALRPHVTRDILDILNLKPVTGHSITPSEANAIAQAISVPNSEARKNYCEYGYTTTSPVDASTSKYPYISFANKQGWVGNVPNAKDNGWLLNLVYASGYSQVDFDHVLEQKPVYVNEGVDMLYDTTGLIPTVTDLLDILNPNTGSSLLYSRLDQPSMSIEQKSELPNNGYQYKCSLVNAGVDLSILNFLTGFLGLQQNALAMDCDAPVSQILGVLDALTSPLFNLLGGLLLKPLGLDGLLGFLGVDGLTQILDDLLDPDVVVSDPVYIGRSGVCIYGTDEDSLNPGSCLHNGIEYQSCRAIMSSMPNDKVMSFGERLTAFLLGPLTDWNASYESLDCEVSHFKYKGWLFWGGWEEL
ncbi:hypothetical protein [Thiomicrorhabdus heinhorstiae]|uniref:Flp pilus-assembly TadG-like N-terminal domain-containing protein n=1 Tax=Thiomicrorhabdus heinhorstiae TaxID=2748010 RepID=A0ABS0C2Z2_9GAMM|nr:hypothetical protein [Thiomicrorhabdus heinhorstiae]MBF6058652.1 hypothetical protein [Thiomicrorhabdus heinhorstiae]